MNLLVGGNNSGKTTIFHALQLVFWCIDQTTDLTADSVVFKKTQVPEVGAIPYFNARDLFYNQRTRSGTSPTRIKLALEADGIPRLQFSIYPAFSRNIMIDGGNQTLTRSQYELLSTLKPVYVPGTIGITVREEMYRTVAQERLILEGRQNQVLRNLVYRLSKEESSWNSFVSMIKPLFNLTDLSVPFDEAKDEWLQAVYNENEGQFDLISGGSGFLQVINLLCFLFLHTSRVALLDEPDSHMHDDLQKLTFDILDKLSNERNIQLIIATHSPTFIDAAGLDNVLLIDKKCPEPLKAKNVDTLLPLLSDRGLALPPTKVLNTLKGRKVLFVEGLEADYDEFIQRLGECYLPGFRANTRGLMVFQTTGATKKWPFDAIECFETLIGVPLKFLFLSDRDFLSDKQIADREEKAMKEQKDVVHLQRRNREAYLLEPKILARVIEAKWRSKSGDPVPLEFAEKGLTDRIIAAARKLEVETQATFMTEQERFLRLPASEKHAATVELLAFFKENYTDVISAGQIPTKLLDAKAVLRELRTHIAEQLKISFNDREVFEAFQRGDIPQDLRHALERVLKLFPSNRKDGFAIPMDLPLRDEIID